MNQRRGDQRRRDDRDEGRSTLEERVFRPNRVAKVQKGGRRFSFTAMVVVGDRQGRVGVGYGKAKEPPLAIDKARDRAKTRMSPIAMIGATIPHPVIGEDGAARVMLKPAAPGTGVIAGASVRSVLECAGIEDCVTKVLGTTNPINVVHATMAGLKSLRMPDQVARLRGKSVDEVAPAKMLERIRESRNKGEAQTLGQDGGEAR